MSLKISAYSFLLIGGFQPALFALPSSVPYLISHSISAVFSGQLFETWTPLVLLLPKNAFLCKSSVFLCLSSVAISCSYFCSWLYDKVMQFCLCSVQGNIVQEELGCCTSDADKCNMYICCCTFNTNYITNFQKSSSQLTFAKYFSIILTFKMRKLRQVPKAMLPRPTTATKCVEGVYQKQQRITEMATSKPINDLI